MRAAVRTYSDIVDLAKSFSFSSPAAHTENARAATWAALGDRHFAVHLATAFVAYFIAGKLGQATTSIRSSNLGPVWPAYGVAVAAFLAYGYRIWPAVAASAFLVAVQGSVGALAAAGQAAGATMAAACATWSLRRIGFDASVARLRDALGLIVFGAFGSALVSASIGTAAMSLTGNQAYSGLPSAWLIYWFGDSTGVLVVTPLVFTARQLLERASQSRRIELLALVALVSTGCFVVFGGLPFVPPRLDVMAFAQLPFVMWGAIDFGIGGASLTVFIIATLATILTALRFGPFAIHSSFINAILLDILFAVFAVSGLTLAAVITERERAESERERLIRERAAVEARLRLAAIVESSNDSILSKDLDGTIQSWNHAAERMFEYSEAEVIGKPVNILIPPERQHQQQQILQRLRAGESIEQLETVRISKTGKARKVLLTISPVRDSEGRLIGAAEVARDITELRRAEDALATVDRKMLDAQEQERARIARELHDDISQRLALLSVDLAGLSEDLETQAIGISRDVQALSRELHSSRIETLGITAGMRVFCREFAEHHHVRIDFEARDVPTGIPAGISLSLFRVLQEALRNSGKHSGASRVEVRLWTEAGWLNLRVHDDGTGFDVDTALARGGIGLLTMCERMKLIGGELWIQSKPQRGTTVHARTSTGTVDPAQASAAPPG